MLKSSLLVLLLLAVLLLASSASASAAPLQQATATPAPTAAYSEDVSLTSGHTLQVQRTWSFGEIATFLAVVAVLLVDLAGIVMAQVTRWTH